MYSLLEASGLFECDGDETEIDAGHARMSIRISVVVTQTLEREREQIKMRKMQAGSDACTAEHQRA